MNIEKVLEKLSEYITIEGKAVFYKGNPIRINKVVAAPSNFEEFKANYKSYIEDSIGTVKLGLSEDYDIYFFENPYTNNFIINLDDFIENCKII